METLVVDCVLDCSRQHHCLDVALGLGGVVSRHGVKLIREDLVADLRRVFSFVRAAEDLEFLSHCAK